MLTTSLSIDFLFSQVGCGCGFLSMLAADAEASRVIGIESSAIAKIAQQIVADNQLDQVVSHQGQGGGGGTP